MARYNAAHRGAETSLFPIAQEFETPVVTFTSLRWKGLLQSHSQRILRISNLQVHPIGIAWFSPTPRWPSH